MIIDTVAIFLSKIMFFTSFVNSVSGFPKPLTREEEEEAVIKMNKGDKDARELLIIHNLRLVAHIVKKYKTAGDADDFISVGIIGLIKAINTYSLDKGTQLSTYASRCIENEILMLLRISKKHNQVYSLEESLGNDKDGNEITLSDIIPINERSVDKIVESKIMTEELIAGMKKILSEREFNIIVLRYGVNNTPELTQLEVAKKLGISRSYVSRIETKALKTIREYMKKNDMYID